MKPLLFITIYIVSGCKKLDHTNINQQLNEHSGKHLPQNMESNTLTIIKSITIKLV